MATSWKRSGAGDDRFAILDTTGFKTIVDEAGTNTLALGWGLDDIEVSRGSLIFTHISTGQQAHVLDRQDPDAGPTSTTWNWSTGMVRPTSGHWPTCWTT